MGNVEPEYTVTKPPTPPPPPPLPGTPITQAEGLLFYEASTETGEFYSTDGQGGISLLQQHTDWRRDWSQILALS